MSLKGLIRNCIPASFLASDTETMKEDLTDLKRRCEEWLVAQAEPPAAGDSEDPRAAPQKVKKPVVLHSSGFELSNIQLERIYKRMKYDVNESFKEWVVWVQWRRDMCVNDFKEEDFAVLTKMGFADWRGQDKEGRPCLVLTARLLDRYIEPQPEVKLFQQYLIYMAEKGVHLCDELQVEHACIIYDRRAMETRHTSVTLHNAMRPILQNVHRFYSRERIGRLYIVHLNLVYSIFLSVLLKPLMAVLDDSSKLVSVQTKGELREYFDSNGLLLAGSGLEEWPNDEGNGAGEVPDTEMERVTDTETEIGWQEGQGPVADAKQSSAVKQASSSKPAEAELTELKV